VHVDKVRVGVIAGENVDSARWPRAGGDEVGFAALAGLFGGNSGCSPECDKDVSAGLIFGRGCPGKRPGAGKPAWLQAKATGDRLCCSTTCPGFSNQELLV
jgi:hypothetical protein